MVSAAAVARGLPKVATIPPAEGVGTMTTTAATAGKAGAMLPAKGVANRQPSRVALAVATEQFAADDGAAAMQGGAYVSGADLLAEGIIDAIWLDEHLAQAAKGK